MVGSIGRVRMGVHIMIGCGEVVQGPKGKDKKCVFDVEVKRGTNKETQRGALLWLVNLPWFCCSPLFLSHQDLINFKVVRSYLKT